MQTDARGWECSQTGLAIVLLDSMEFLAEFRRSPLYVQMISMLSMFSILVQILNHKAIYFFLKAAKN